MSLEAVRTTRQLCRLEEVCSEVGVSREVFLEFVRKEWIRPPATDQNEWEEEDVARATLIRELLEDFGVNDEAVPIILHLIDQLNAIRAAARRSA